MTQKPWLSTYPPEIPTTLEYDQIPLQEYLTRSGKKYPEQTAIHFMGKDISFREFHESALKFAAYLQKLGVEKGDRVAIMLPNCPQGAIAYFGILYAGGIVVQTNPLYTERELSYQMADSGAKAIISLDILFPRISKAMKSTSLEHVIITSIKDYLPFPKNLIYPFIQKKEHGVTVKVEHRGKHHLYTEIMKSTKPEPVHVTFEKGDIALLQYTGGTTGPPKGVELTHANLISNTEMCSAWLYKTEEGKETIM